MRTAKILIRLGGCPGWSESLLGAHSCCWFCHVAAQMTIIRMFFSYFVARSHALFCTKPKHKNNKPLKCRIIKHRPQLDFHLKHLVIKPVYVVHVCKQQRHRSAWESAQSDHRLCYSLPRQHNACSYRCYIQNIKTLASFCSWAGRFESCLVAHPRRQVSRDIAHLSRDTPKSVMQLIYNAIVKGKVQWNVTITSRSPPLTARGREKKTERNACKINKQTHGQHADHLSLPLVS